MEALFLRVAVLSLTGSAVLLPLLLLSGRIHHRYAAKTCYFLWLLLALRLLQLIVKIIGSQLIDLQQRCLKIRLCSRLFAVFNLW